METATIMRRVRLESILAAALVSISSTPVAGQEFLDDSEQSLVLVDSQIGLQIRKLPGVEFSIIEQRLRQQLIPYFSNESSKRAAVLRDGGLQEVLFLAKSKLRKSEQLSTSEKAALDLFMLERELLEAAS